MDYNTREHRFQFRSLKNGSFGHFCGWAADGVTSDEEDQANAQFIVRAVNAHSDLLAACEFVLSQLSPPDAKGAQCILYSDCLSPKDTDDETVVDMLRAVVSKAKTP